MHSINLILTVNNGHQELLEQISQLLAARNIKICSQTECQISTTIVGMSAAENSESSFTDTVANAISSQEVPVEEPIQVLVEPVDTFPKTCKVMQLSTTNEVPIKRDTDSRISSLHVKNLHISNGMAMFEYCGSFYKSVFSSQPDPNSYTTINYIQCSISCGDKIIRCALELVNSDECCVVAGSNLIHQLS